MKKLNLFGLATVIMAISILAVGCNDAAEGGGGTVAPTGEQAAAKPDMAKVKAEIVALEKAWADASNAMDTTALLNFYSDDAITMGNNKPMMVGKAAIKKDLEEGFAKRKKGSIVSFEVLDVYGTEDVVTEVGTIAVKDEAGKQTYAGKYMAVWEKRDGKYVCVRDISNDDAKEK